MKTIVTTALLFLFTLAAHAELREVGYTLGPQLFRDSDSIKIEEVKATSSTFKIGENVTVKGTYTLESHEAGKISIYVTQIKKDGRSKTSPEQQFEVKKGEGNFEVNIQIQHEGYLHVTFYPSEGGSGFGGVYFGKSKQMNEIEDWTLDWYLGGPVTAGHTDRVNQSR